LLQGTTVDKQELGGVWVGQDLIASSTCVQFPRISSQLWLQNSILLTKLEILMRSGWGSGVEIEIWETFSSRYRLDEECKEEGVDEGSCVARN
jgi:hypothetical protein